MLMPYRNAPRRGIAKLLRDEDGAGVVELIMIIAVVIIVAIIFREYLIDLVKTLMGRAETEANDIFNYDANKHFPGSK
ncbi:Flp1 family type IVb pilin [Thermobacillus sp. ZCTH02-B1]|uniref:Flp1 family type IVb pilin n=1 Tax=Thermobacillus sp. ZCTH02-B1 TaxID=1858795 RepID=UPI0025CFD43F|nr:Flp1 family type IVb pilin [Thermobacillus sp. ZCTH02-B1]